MCACSVAIMGSRIKGLRARECVWWSGAGIMANLPTPMWVLMVQGHAAVERLFMDALDADDMQRDERSRLEQLCESVLETLRAQAISAVQVANGALADAGFSPTTAGRSSSEGYPARKAGQRVLGHGSGHAAGPFAGSAGQSSSQGAAAVSIFGPLQHPPHVVAQAPPVGGGGQLVDPRGGLAAAAGATPGPKGVKAPPPGMVVVAAPRVKPPPPVGAPPALPAGVAAVAQATAVGGLRPSSPPPPSRPLATTVV